MRSTVCALSLLTVAAAAAAGTPADIIADLRSQANAAGASPRGFEAGRGAAFYARRGREWSCSSCHTDDPRAVGLHVVTRRTIAPLAPVANEQRFTDPRKVDKWFLRNCRDVLGRACSVEEKGDLLTWLLTLQN